MATDFEAEGLLDRIADPRARRERLELLQSLEADGFGLDELREAAGGDRLALLPLERQLESEGERYTAEEIAAETGLSLDLLAEARRALGGPAVEPDDRVLTEADLELTRGAAALLESGLEREAFLELTRVMSQAMNTVAAAMTSTFGAALMRPDDSERALGLRYAESMRDLGPLAVPTLKRMLEQHMREQIRQAVVGQAELSSGRLPGAQVVAVGFVDIVGFTRLGEDVAPDELGAVVGEFERAVEEAAAPPVRLVKTIGDAAMLVSQDVRATVEAVLSLVEDSIEHEQRPLLRGGVAMGEALPRGGDWYGRPVNLAARLTSFARRGSVVTSKEAREAAGEEYSWSSAGRRRFKGVRGEVEVFRVRPPGSD